MPTITEQGEGIRSAWVAPHLPAGWVAIFANQNAPRPSNLETPTKYVTIRLGPLVKLGLRDHLGPVAVDLSRPMVGDRETTVAIEAFGVGSLQVLEDLRSALDREDVHQALAEEGLAVFATQPAQNLTGLYDTQNLERGLLEVRMRTVAEASEANVSYIQTVEGEGKVVSPSGSEKTVPFTVP